jgi:hypothetical protein
MSGRRHHREARMAFSLLRLFARVLAWQRQPGASTGALTAAQARLLRDVQPSGVGSLYFGAEDATARDAGCAPGAPPRPRRAPTDA